MSTGLPTTMFCSKCGTQSSGDSRFCGSCGEPFSPSAGRAVSAPVASAYAVPSDSPLDGLIPAKNPPALAAYYLAVFSVLPLIGILLGIPAFFLGLKGLRLVRTNPEVRGKVHALIGVFVGGFFGFGYLLLTVALVFRAARG